MDVNKFKKEFSQLLLHYTKLTAADKNVTPEIQTLLTNQQIIDAIYDTLRTTLSINLQNFTSDDLKTPANEIIVTTPNAPDVLKRDCNQNNTLMQRYQSALESLKSSDILSAPIEEDMDTSDHDVTLANDIKMNNYRSSQNQCLLGSDDTILEDDATLRDKLRKEIGQVDANQRITMFYTIDEAHTSALNVVNKLQIFREQLLVPEMRPVRRLSSIMNLPKSKSAQSLPASGPTGSNLRTMQRFKIARRSSTQSSSNDTSVPLTPTSRMSLPPPPPPSPVRPTTAHIPKKKPLAVNARAFVSRLNQRTSSTTSLSSTDSIKPKVTFAAPKSPSRIRNPKYAHVRSTIPKPISVKRKAT